MFGAKTKKVSVFMIKIVYKSGATHEFECFNFDAKVQGGEIMSVTWTSVDKNNRPIAIGVPEIAAVWQVGHREMEVPADPNEGAQP